MKDWLEKHWQPVMRMLDDFGFTVGHTRLSLYTVLVAIIVLAGVVIAGRLMSALGRRTLHRITALDPGQQELGEKLVTIGVWAFVVMVGIDILGIDLTAFTVFSGAFGLAVGFGLQKTFGNLISGIILLMDRSIKPGDVIAINDGNNMAVGEVKRIGIRAVSITTRDKIEFLIPNENLMINQVENWSYSSRDVRVRIPVGVGYGTDIVKAEALILDAVKDIDRVLKDPRPSVLLTAFADNSINMEVHVWINDPEDGTGNVLSDVLKVLWRTFRDNGIEIPFPQRDVHIRDWPRALPGPASPPGA